MTYIPQKERIMEGLASAIPTYYSAGPDDIGRLYYATDEETLYRWDGDSWEEISAGGGGGGGHTIQDDGTPMTQRTNLNFTGNLITVSDDEPNDATIVDTVLDDDHVVDGFYAVQHTGTYTAGQSQNFTSSGSFSWWESAVIANGEYILSISKITIDLRAGTYTLSIDGTDIESKTFASNTAGTEWDVDFTLSFGQSANVRFTRSAAATSWLATPWYNGTFWKVIQSTSNGGVNTLYANPMSFTFTVRTVVANVITRKGMVYSPVNVSNPPTDAELDTAYGTPATVGAGFMRLLDDNGAGANVYLIGSDGANWWYTAMTKAT
jgi:hypothetical protein